jgi:phosphoesterase RecJ-like protein
MEFLGPEDGEIPEEKYADALGIAVDTGTLERLSNQNFEKCKETIKIDHHINNSPYGDLMWVEEERSSACEMIVKFYDTFKDELKMTKEAAFYLYTGMVTDSGRFKYDGVKGETLRLAGILLDQDINTEWLFANLYLDEFSQLKFKSHVYETMQITENGVAYIYIDQETQKKYGISLEDASTSISYLDSIKGCLSWLAFIETGDDKGTIRVRLRSRFVPINPIAEQYRGGGHAYAAGATLYEKAEVDELLAKMDKHIKEYKETHDGWL